MSIDIVWIPVGPVVEQRLHTSTPSALKEALTRAFGEFPRVLREGHIERLVGMAACWTNTASEEKPFEALIEAIEKHGQIELRSR